MLLYALKRLLYVMPVAIGVSVLCFLLVHIAPGDPHGRSRASGHGALEY